MAGRPKAVIDLEELEKLANLHCTDEEVAAWFRVTPKTIQRRKQDPKFLEVLDRGRARGRVSLRKAQFKAAVNQGNVTAQIWLGKQLLGQKDKVDHSGEVGVEFRRVIVGVSEEEI